MRKKRISCLLILMMSWVGCLTYEARPLVPSDVLEKVEEARRLLNGDLEGSLIDEEVAVTKQAGHEGNGAELFTFRKAALWMDRSSPHLKRARAAFQQAWSFSQIPTPWPNPGITVGPKIGSDLGSEGASRRIQPMVEFGFSIPLSARLEYADDLNQAVADEAWVRLVTEHRRRYLELHALYTEWVLVRKRRDMQAQIRKSTGRSLELTRRLVDAGAAGALDLGLMELETAQADHEYLHHLTRMKKAEEALCGLIGVHGDLFRDAPMSDLPSLDFDLPDLEEAKETMIANHPGLAVLRARYEVTERKLRLEIEKQYPDLSLGTSYEGEPGERKETWGLSLGIEIPVFDRNEQAIDQAWEEREKARVDYEALLTESLSALESLYAVYGLGREKRKLLEEVVLPRSRENLDVAMAAMQAAALDSLKYLEVERKLRAVLVEAIEAESEIRKTVNDMEQAVGMPLVLFPGEGPESYPLLPENLKRAVEREEGDSPANGRETKE